MLPPSRRDKNTLKYVKNRGENDTMFTLCAHYRFVNMYDRRLKPPAPETTTENKASEAGRPTLQSAAAHHDNGNPHI